ncbi:beta-N-acetylhexosaminidase [Winogradskyella aurantiaca]|uniref:beta-N-acetylhexosaminidase n=1 Tax=Winogradskyella aurantiaca TaxID=2219558 RepID=UPI000E1D20B0|nr:family 20 glycosylhydrolase [Winogradskyella aurantiaca]
MPSKPFLSILFLFTFLVNCSQPAERLEYQGIIPQPDQVTLEEGHFSLASKVGVAYTEDFKTSGQFLLSYLQVAGIEVELGDDVVFVKNDALAEESYALEIGPNHIRIEASSDQGAFYAVQSLRQILPPNYEARSKELKTYELPCLRIEDAPQFEYRGMHLDVGRHMFPVAFIKKYIDALAMLKMNTFHWHLTEDQGWRVEIKQYPKLQEVAAFRKETLVGHYSDQPHQFDGMGYGGYYSQEEIKEVVAYAKERFVTIIPEIEMPGHSQAVIAAYPELGCTGEEVEVATKWGVFEDIYCPKEATFTFLENVLDEVMDLFPSTYIHIGGDEAPKAQWKACKECQDLMKNEGLKDEHELQNYFITRIEKFLNSKGRQIIGWDEILEGGLAPNATVMSWRGTSVAIAAARQQHQVVMTPTSHCYFDYYQSENEEEPLAIGGFLPLEKVYNFNPIPEELTPEEAQYVWGAQGNIWTEYMPTTQQVEYMAFPRILAMSEVVWTNPERKDYNDFLGRVEKFHARLEALDINYANHLYEINGEMISDDEGAAYKLETLSKGKTIIFTLDGSDPDKESTVYTSPIPIANSATIKAQIFKGNKPLGKVFEQYINFHKGVGAKISINKTAHQAYSGSGPEGLINGVSGSDNRYGDKEWLGFWGEDIEINIDLGEAQEVECVDTRFFHSEGQWIYAPNSVGLSFFDENEVQLGKTMELEPYKNNERWFALNHYCSVPNFEAPSNRVRYIQLKVSNYGTIPEGKQGAGQKAWTFIDEIIIE